MTYEECVAKVREVVSGLDCSEIVEHIAIQINVVGDPEGAFYLETKENQIDVQPYEYYDRDAIVTTDAKPIIGIAEKELDFAKLCNGQVVRVEGNYEKAEKLFQHVGIKKEEHAQEVVATVTIQQINPTESSKEVHKTNNKKHSKSKRK